MRWRTTFMLKQKSRFSCSLKRNCYFLFVLHRRNFSTDLTLICKTLLQLERQVLNWSGILLWMRYAWQQLMWKKLGRYVEVSLCFFKALTFVNVLNETSNKQRKHRTVVILVKPGKIFLRNKEIQLLVKHRQTSSIIKVTIMLRWHVNGPILLRDCFCFSISDIS